MQYRKQSTVSLSRKCPTHTYLYFISYNHGYNSTVSLHFISSLVADVSVDIECQNNEAIDELSDAINIDLCVS